MTLEEALADAYCPCHGEPWAPNGPRRACRINKRERQVRQKKTPKGRARIARYEATPKGRARKSRYEATPGGRSVGLIRKDNYHRRARLKEAGLL